jgi:glycosyltransferase involved in cell wall biosynthesis
MDAPGVISHPRLSVIVICLNQRELVLACVRSVLRETSLQAEPREIIVVDSASTDGTRKALAGMPIRWVGIDESPLLCASLGRWVGTERSAGEYLLFLDGDMELFEGFVPAALAALERMPGAAGIVGQVLEKDPSSPGTWRDIYRIKDDAVAARFGGACLFRRSSLLAAGGFDPYIFNREENELYSRIRKGGESVWQLPVPMAVHNDPPASASEKVLREVLPGRKKPLGRAQAFLRSLRKGNLLSYIRQEWLFFYSLFTDMSSAAALLILPYPADWIVTGALQAGSLAVHGSAWSFRQYVLNKLALFQFFPGLFMARALLRKPLPAIEESP